MTDLVGRLRGIAADYAHLSTIYPVYAEVVEQEEVEAFLAAADEIERLRAALRGLLTDTQHAEHDCGDEDCPVAVARAALGKNNHG